MSATLSAPRLARPRPAAAALPAPATDLDARILDATVAFALGQLATRSAVREVIA